MTKPIFISFYTKNTIYQDISNKMLTPSLEKLKLEYHIYNIKSLGDWKSNAILKPKILLRALNDFPNQDIIWNDVDSEVLKYPDLLFNVHEKYDIALCYLKWESHYGRPSDKGKSELLDGTVFWRNNERVKQFINELIIRSTNKGIDHQKTMAKMLNENVFGLKVLTLPREYSYLTSKPNGDKPAVELDDPVIIHYQKSREGKRFI